LAKEREREREREQNFIKARKVHNTSCNPTITQQGHVSHQAGRLVKYTILITKITQK